MMLTFQLATYGTEKRLRIFLDSFLDDNGEEPATAPVRMIIPPSAFLAIANSNPPSSPPVRAQARANAMRPLLPEAAHAVGAHLQRVS